jgi:hypothetical protein
MQHSRAKHLTAPLLLDNISGLCPQEDEPKTLIHTVKTSIFTTLVTSWVEEGEVKIVAVARHFTLVNPRLF